MFKTIGIAFFAVGVLLAQDGGEKTTVPLHDPSRPGRIEAHLMSGSIIVHGASVKDVIVEARSRGREDLRERRPARADGMKRLDLGGTGLDVVEDNNVVHIKTSSWTTPSDLLITVPRHSSLELKTINNGNIEVQDVEGEIERQRCQRQNRAQEYRRLGGGAFSERRSGGNFGSCRSIEADVLQHYERQISMSLFLRP